PRSTDRSTVSGLVPDRAWWTNSRSSKSERRGPSVCWAEARRTWSSLRAARGDGVSELIDLAFLFVRAEAEVPDAVGLPAGQDGLRGPGVLLGQGDAAVPAAGARGLRGRPVGLGDGAQVPQGLGLDEAARGLPEALQQCAGRTDRVQRGGIIIVIAGGHEVVDEAVGLGGERGEGLRFGLARGVHAFDEVLGGGRRSRPADEQPQGGGRADPPDPGSGPLTAVERGDETVFGTVGAQGGTVGGGVADPAAEGARRQVPARGVGGDGDGCEQGELEAFGGAEAQGVELVEGGHGGHGHRGRGSESELPSVGVVEFAGDVEVEVAGGDTAGGTQLLERRDRREHVVGGTVLEDDGL